MIGLQRGRKVLRVSESIRGRHLKRGCDRFVDGGGYARPECANPRSRRGEAAGEHRLRRRAAEGLIARERLVQHAAERIQIAPPIDRFSGGLLGAHIGNRAKYRHPFGSAHPAIRR